MSGHKPFACQVWQDHSFEGQICKYCGLNSELIRKHGYSPIPCLSFRLRCVACGKVSRSTKVQYARAQESGFFESLCCRAMAVVVSVEIQKVGKELK